MAYHNISTKLKVAMTANWYEIDSLMTFVKKARRINFSLVEQRQQIIQEFNLLVSDVPFGLAKRFPANSLYICDALGDWSRKFQQIRLALSYKDRDIKEKIPSTETKEASFADSIVSYHNALNSIQEQLVCGDNLWDQPKLEGYFQMDWH